MPNGYIKSKNGNPVEIVDASARRKLPVSVNVAITYTDNTTYTVTSIDKTFAELSEAISGGCQAQAVITRTNWNGSTSSYTVPCVSATSSKIIFGGLQSLTQKTQGTWETSQTYVFNGSDCFIIKSNDTYGFHAATTLTYPSNTLILLKTNTNPWTPTEDYQPATKKYVDDAVSEMDSTITDVQINGVSIAADGVANVPVASDTDFGVVKTGSYGVGRNSSGVLMLTAPTTDNITKRQYGYKPITVSVLDYSVISVLTDGKAPALSDEQKTSALDWLGVNDLIGDIETALDAILGGDA